jgi:hypothetical protein
MKSFDKIIAALQDAAVYPWNDILTQVVSKGEVMMCLRWHYNSSVIVRLAVQRTMPTVLLAVRSCAPDENTAVKCSCQVVRILGCMQEYKTQVVGTDMEDVARAACDLMSPGTVSPTLAQDLLLLAIRSDAMDTAVRTCMTSCACKFTALGAPIVASAEVE